MAAPRFHILTWHSVHVLENRYAENDLLAFASDLRTLDRLGYRIWPLSDAFDALAAGNLPERVVALAADDGAVLDFEDFDHPTCGPQKSMFRILREFAGEAGADYRPHLSSFVIASPGARAELDRKDFLGLDVWHDRWWKPATESGQVAVESHSWDHNHPSLDKTCQRDNRKGDFRLIDTEAECRAEIDQASDYIERVTGRRPRFLAYPWGLASDYLKEEYLPRHGPGLGLDAALGCRPEPVHAGSPRWCLPRFMCGRDWHSPEELERMLAE